MSLDAKEFYFLNGLYQATSFVEEDFERLFNLIFWPGRLDLYCPYCQKETTFEPIPRREKKGDGPFNSTEEIFSFSDFKEKFNFDYFRNGRRFEINYKCIREPYLPHSIYFQMIIENQSVMKIGQFPSVADISKDETKRYKSVLTNEYYVELNKAIGLYSHGIGIGSFVYMRRIFEKLIYNTFEEFKEELKIDYKEFFGLKMADKIGVLSDYLPKTLVEKKALYSVLSKGIHELDENTCKESFPIVRAGIEFILDEKITQIERKAKEAKFSKDFEALLKKIK